MSIEIEDINYLYNILYEIMPRRKSNEVLSMDYLTFSAYIGDPNVAPGGWNTIKKLVDNSNINSKSNILDIGSNTGHSSFLLKMLTDAKVTGIDIRNDLVEISKKICDYVDLNVDFICGDIKDMPFENKEFTHIITTGTLAFLSNGHQKALEEMHRVLVNNGVAIDTCLYYKIKPPKDVIKRASQKLESELLNYDLNQYKELYERCGFKLFNQVSMSEDYSDVDINKVIDHILYREEILCREENMPIGEDYKLALKNRLTETLTVFKENENYLSGEILFFQKND
ncbi:Class I SAM-dependent methyltransferase [Bacillus subtilis]|nr:class I SAM-dependent methyltransferase [Bacillus subtilis]MBL3637538.1 class I SAM-dependent methyltransferase [Alkalicoccobacillus gibsonii]AYK63029.1 class I SAM-dependent methyltransferase [Bacillus subtilis subsp. subtilis]MBG9627952.1 hypothetical protein [Bacillus subtilis]MCY8985671.1 class I SAM-dependent methyltransferase [Bacillus subtilis]MDD9765746.1 class I SAM-dependent methyltransferase [Bacillus subtilis]